MKFQFKLQSVLTVRQIERDALKHAVAAARELLANRIVEKGLIAHDRSVIMDEIRSMNNGTQWTIDQIIARQRHADQLGKSLAVSQSAIEAAAKQLENAMNRLVSADQSVRALEKLAERQFADFQLLQFKSELNEFYDSAKLDRRSA